MPITRTIYDTATLLGAFAEMEPVSTFWQTLGFSGGTMTFDDEYVDFSRVTDTRRLAPLVVPTAQGLPIYERAQKLFRLKPAYLKPKDPITAAHMIRKRPGADDFLRQAPMSPQERFDATVVDIGEAHNKAIRRSWEKMAADALLTGQIILEDENYPRTVVDFQRDPAHTVTLTAGSFWTDAGVDIVANIETWVSRVERARFSGPVSKLIVGPAAWAAMRSNQKLIDMMDKNAGNSNKPALDLGVSGGIGDYVQFKGNIGRNLEVWLYSDYYEVNGAQINYMDPRDVLLIGGNVGGVMCFGAILDKAAQLQALPIFPKMWDQEDPSVTFLMTQSAPLPVPVNINNTLRARVVA